jgi:hypothetical protein
VLAALADPDRLTSSQHGRRNAWKQIAGRWMREVYTVEDGEHVVITVTLR